MTGAAGGGDVGRVGLVTDSNSQLPPELAERYGVEIVPLTVTVDGEAFAEGVDLDADGFFARYDGGAAPTVTTAAPSPGSFVAAYERLAARGVDEILSVHIGAAVSATLNSARLAVDASPVPVRLVDTGTASFGVAACCWEAAEALARGADIDEAAAVAEALAPSVENVFVVGGLDIVRAGGRLAAGTTDADGIPVLSLVDGEIRAVGAVGDVDAAVEAMAAHVLAGRAASAGRPVKVAVGIADAATAPLSEALWSRLAGEPVVAEVVHYRIGPSVGVHTGPGTVGCFSWG